jgi:hypothetical protein
MTRRLYGSLLGMVFVVNFGRVAFAPLVEPLQASGSAVVGALVKAGYPFTVVFRGFAVGLVVVLALAVTLYSTDRLPAAERVAEPTEA